LSKINAAVRGAFFSDPLDGVVEIIMLGCLLSLFSQNYFTSRTGQIAYSRFLGPASIWLTLKKTTQAEDVLSANSVEDQ
jgi:hypothetical protein